jgi:hypothetical protein
MMLSMHALACLFAAAAACCCCVRLFSVAAAAAACRSLPPHVCAEYITADKRKAAAEPTPSLQLR